jgi:hypothetical protein
MRSHSLSRVRELTTEVDAGRWTAAPGRTLKNRVQRPRSTCAARSRRNFRLATATVLAAGSLLTGCMSTDLLRNADREFDRALRKDQVVAFYEPTLARVRGDIAVPPVSPEARQHYLGVIANLEMVGPKGRQELQADGQLGNAWSLRLLAQWRLGRLDDARISWRELQACHQDAPDQQVRALVAAFGGVVRVEDALAALQAGQNFEQVLSLIAGPNGAWRALGAARMESARAGATPPELLELRLAAFKVLKDAHDRVPPASPLSDALAIAWKRARAEAQIELAEFASLTPRDAATHTAHVSRWQELCGLDPLPR